MSATTLPEQLEAALLSMQAVDHLRYRDAELQRLADAGHDPAALRSRLAELYRSQGIEVSAELLDAGLAAQRERRYLHAAPRGWKAWLARCWVARGRLAAALLALVLVVVVLAGVVGGGASLVQRSRESAAQRFVAAVNQQVAEERSRRGLPKAQLRTLAANLDALAARAVAAHPDRLATMIASARAVQQASSRDIAAVLASIEQAPPPALVRTNGVTRTDGGGQLRDQQAIDAVTRGIADYRRQLRATDAALAAMKAAVATLSTGVDASEQLDAANAAALAVALRPEGERVRQREYAAGDAALRVGDLEAATAASANLRQVALAAGKLAALSDALTQLRAQGLATGVSGADRRQFDAATARAEALLRTDTLAEAEQAREALADMVALLEDRLDYRIVNREGQQSGVWRYNEAAAGGRNYYLVVEALDDKGIATGLLLRNEETGTTENAVEFGVRVPQAVYERVAADKMDNGIIEDDLVGRKPRGRLTPDFTVPLAGGYITRW
ncbi:DUF6384 family protein [Stenotrophomonas sp.]|uniref:DUF6384 family protein n=1 Tax=Stenotrophomonas sp. TaxID=69392 RepID=UPI00289D2982|nr:DUF6384 family protein [Stenotrophomonas sp.]